MVKFAQSLKEGRLIESAVAQYLMRKYGISILPVYDIEIATGKGPQFFSASGSFAAPDLLCWQRRRTMYFVEVKSKSIFTWHRITSNWVTGIDLNHYLDYRKVQELSGASVYLMFLHAGGADERGIETPSGLFHADLNTEPNHIWPHATAAFPHGVVMWRHDQLKKIANYDDVTSTLGMEARK